MKLTLKPLYVATIFALSGYANHALAQQTGQGNDEAEMLEEVIITGSRIRQDPLEQRDGPSPDLLLPNIARARQRRACSSVRQASAEPRSPDLP